MLFVAYGAAALALGCGGGTDSAPRRSPEHAGEGGECADCSASGGEPSQAGTGNAGGASAGTGGSSGENAGAAGADGGDGGGPVVPQLSLRSISIWQTHELPLMAAGASVAKNKRPSPLIAGKRALLRVFVDLDESYTARPLVGVLDLQNGANVSAILSERSLKQSSLQDDLGSTFTFAVPAEELTSTTSYRVRLLEADTRELTRFPDGGFAPLGAKRAEPFEVVMVPLVVDGHAPRFNAVDVEALRARLLALYPISDVEVSVADSVTLDYTLNGDGDGWDEALDDLYGLRDAASPPDNVFFYGMLAPAASYSSYCKTSCILGYSVIADEDDVASRGSMGVTVFPDGSGASDAWETLAHELGHALGRDHANCGLDLGDPPDPDDYDVDYPYPNAGMGGIYGFDFELMRLVKPKSFRDVMSYCVPVWISDYTFRALDERLDFIAESQFRVLAHAAPVLERVARIGRGGTSRWLSDRQRRGASSNVTLPLLDATGQATGDVAARFSRLDHGRGGYVSLPAARLTGAAAVDLRPLGGAILRL